MNKNQNIRRNKNFKSLSKKTKMNAKKEFTFQSIFIKLQKLQRIPTSVHNYETLSKSKTWGANYRIGETC